MDGVGGRGRMVLEDEEEGEEMIGLGAWRREGMEGERGAGGVTTIVFHSADWFERIHL